MDIKKVIILPKFCRSLNLRLYPVPVPPTSTPLFIGLLNGAFTKRILTKRIPTHEVYTHEAYTHNTYTHKTYTHALYTVTKRILYKTYTHKTYTSIPGFSILYFISD
jgi:hypothetical protein